MQELDPVFNRVAAYFRVLSEPMRLRIIHAVCQGEKSVSQIVAATGATQTTVSRHLNQMHLAGALARRREGNLVYYAVADQDLIELCRTVCLRIAAEIDEQQPLRDDLLQLLPQRVAVKGRKPMAGASLTPRPAERRSIKPAPDHA